MRRVLVSASLTVMLAVTLTSCTASSRPSSTLTDAERAAIEREVRAVTGIKFKAVADLDVDTMARVFNRDTFLGYAYGGRPTVTSHEAFMDLLRKAWSSSKEHRGEMRQMAVHPLAPDLALVDYLARWRIVDEKDQAQTLDVSVAMLFRKEQGEWKAIFEHESTRAVQ